MNLKQEKLTKDEWNSIEIPVSAREKEIIKLITEGYNNVGIRKNQTLSLMNYLKIGRSSSHEIFAFTKYIQPKVKSMSLKYGFNVDLLETKKCKLKKADQIRFNNTDSNFVQEKDKLFEFVLLNLIDNLYKHKSKHSNRWLFYHYTLKNLIEYKIDGVNGVFITLVKKLSEDNDTSVNIAELVKMGETIIERNNYLMKYTDDVLYDHQKQLFTLCKITRPKMIQYIAPTGTGKTLSPLGLSEKHRVIFVCAARHVGLALAKAAISCHKKVAFAFGCNDAEDIRLHYFAAKDYTVNRRSGGIFRVDNTVGDKVEIMITDIKSYLPAMYYMLAFNDAANIILYWDEPTITLDYKEHEFHPIIQRNWKKNQIPNVILSSATLPHTHEMMPTISDFRSRFLGADVHTIMSHDCKKTIPLIEKNGFVAMPHYLTRDYEDIRRIVQRCSQNKTLLRYIDLGEAIRFVTHKSVQNAITDVCYSIDQNFRTIEDVTMYNIKNYYLDVLGHIEPNKWSGVIETIIVSRKPHQVSNIHIVTSDAQTLTDGPTIFLADDVEKVARFCIQESEIPEKVAQRIMKDINFNSVINSKVSTLKKTYEDGTREDEGKEKKLADGRVKPEMKRVLNTINDLNACLKSVELDPQYVPNSKEHLNRFGLHNKTNGIPFMCDISESIVEQIMMIDDVQDLWKMLLLMGVGVFSQHTSVRYAEVMKSLAQQQKLMIIIASSDYIYGTNYQFCHGYISKDLSHMSQEKCIQAMGRVGRNNLQQHYSLRFRDNNLISKLFHDEKGRPEVENMEKLFNS